MNLPFKRYHPPGTPPGTLIRREPHEAKPPRIVMLRYDRERIEEIPDATPEQCGDSRARNANTWVHISGHPEIEELHALGAQLKLHSLALEDVVNTVQRPKTETFDKQLFIVTNLPLEKNGKITTEQISLFLMERRLVSFYDGSPELFEPIYKRLRSEASLTRRGGTDVLLCMILDLVIDHGFPVLEAVGEQLEHLEDDILRSPDNPCLERLHSIRRKLVSLRRMLWPQREVLHRLMDESGELINEQTKVYLRDCYDHTIQMMDLVDTYRDTAASLLDVYLSGVSNRMNETMRVLTVIATVFIPPTFLASIYGMNFDRHASPWNMPELGWSWGYPLAWGAMIVTMAVMLVYFKRRDWF